MEALNGMLTLPRIYEIGLGALPPKWRNFADKHKVKLHVVALCQNAAQTGKLWPATKIFDDAIAAGKHLTTDTVIDSSSGNYISAIAVALKILRNQDPNFPIQRVVAVIPRTLERGKRRAVEEQGIEIVEANDSNHAQDLAREVAEKHGWWYTEQYWNESNPAGYERAAEHLFKRVPAIGIYAGGIGSGGSFSGMAGTLSRLVRQMRHDPPMGFQRVAVVAEEGESIGGVRGESGLRPGTLNWRQYADEVRFVTAARSYAFSIALWQQPREVCFGGPSTGFVAEGGMLAAHNLAMLEKLDYYRASDGYVHVAIPSMDKRDPYRAEFEKHNGYFPA